MKVSLCAGLFAAVGVTNVFAWDPIGDITNPGRIVENIQRETGAAANNVGRETGIAINNVGRELDSAAREIDRMRIEANAQAGAPVFEQWLRESRNTASRGSRPIPPRIRQQLQGFYDDGLLNSVRYKVGDPGVFNLANLSIQYGGAGAVTLIDVVVFKNANDAYQNAALWAHELKHVQQFADWGVRDFAIKYLRSWNGVEGEAYATEDSFVQWSSARVQQPLDDSALSPANVGIMSGPSIASLCATPFGACGMGVQIPVGSQCYCPTYNGPIWGVAQ